MELSPSQLNAMQATERVTSIFSLLGILFILSTFLLARGFDKPINRLIFLASWSNLGMNIATLIAEDGPIAGQRTSLCQFQAWTIQMFLGVDVFWALCMSLNVYLALFQRWTAQRMRAQEWKYFVACYGLSAVPAFTYLGVRSEDRGMVYGPAILWCWITTEWDFLRIATLYGIVWIAIFFAFCIYCLAFIKVWRHRHELTGLFNPFNEDPFSGTRTTEVEITREDRKDVDSWSLHHQRSPDAPPIPGLADDGAQEGINPYTVNVEAGIPEGENGHRPSRPEVFRVRSLTRNAALSETNPDAWLYARVAFLFFCALLVSWIPASINRVYSLARPDHLVFGLNYAEAVVLPLQGLWNCCVYVITSQTAVRNLFRAVLGRPPLARKNPDSDRSGLDDSTEDRGKGFSMGMGKVAASLSKSDSIVDKYTSKRASRVEGDGRQRLESHGSSMASLKASDRR